MDKKYDPCHFFLKYGEWLKKDEENIKSQQDETIAKRVKLRGQKQDDEDLSDSQTNY